MKKFFTLAMVIALVFAGCDDKTSEDTGNTAQLTIKNESSYELTDVLWNNVSFANNQSENSIKPGTSVTMTVQAGSGYIRFKPSLNPVSLRTSQLLIVEKDKQGEFIFLNNTIVVNESNTSNAGTLGSFSGVPLILLRQGDTVIAQNGDYNFETILIGSTRELTFTIENSGGEVLSIEAVNGNRVNLTNNTSGFFNINMQPISSTIAPGSSLTFTIRFNPLTEGNNYNATVRIETNSHVNKEFVFRITGNGRTYQAGDEVPLITIKQSNTAITQYGEYDFGRVAIGEPKDITFTIENSGGANLVIETVNSSRVSLTDNNSGYYSVNQQPLATTITPGNSAAFTIRFNPETEGNNFNAAVHIKTNSHVNSEFAFLVKGNSYEKRPKVTIKQGNTVITQNSEYDFGRVAIGEQKDITFTIENSGEANLIIEAVSGNRVNLEENNSGFYSVYQQPLTTTIIPGNSVVFIIRFNPTTEGNDLNTAVQIKTNSHIYGDFAFLVKGNSYEKRPQITVKQGNIIIPQNSEFNFETVRTGNTKEITFTIENSGEAILTIEPVGGNRINLSDNTSGFYSVNFQPPSLTISPGSSTTFAIRFNPTTMGNNYNATVQIKTDSHSYSDFAFRIIGNASDDYQIGDTGPGGGIVFFVQGNTYAECSEELGVNVWSDAVTLAQNFKGNGFTDWRLSTRSELDLMYRNLHLQNLGGFLNAIYWSSTVDSISYRWAQNFSNGAQTSYTLGNSLRVRAVRTFTLE
jgi:hypothetical protein